MERGRLRHHLQVHVPEHGVLRFVVEPGLELVLVLQRDNLKIVGHVSRWGDGFRLMGA